MNMREILFRGKRTDNGAWVEGAFCMKDCDEPFGEMLDRPSIIKYDPPCDGFWYIVNPETVVQFTGLTDKDGKKIFEGDIIKTKNKFPDGTDHEAKVVADLDDFYLMWCIKHSIETEVIGNIYENPELLEVDDGN